MTTLVTPSDFQAPIGTPISTGTRAQHSTRRVRGAAQLRNAREIERPHLKRERWASCPTLSVRSEQFAVSPFGTRSAAMVCVLFGQAGRQQRAWNRRTELGRAQLTVGLIWSQVCSPPSSSGR